MKAISEQYIHFLMLGKDVCINFNNEMIIKMAINIKSGTLMTASTEGTDITGTHITHNFEISLVLMDKNARASIFFCINLMGYLRCLI